MDMTEAWNTIHLMLRNLVASLPRFALAIVLVVFFYFLGWLVRRGMTRAGHIDSAHHTLNIALGFFVEARFLQGMGGAMMTPVGRLVLLRSIDKSALVNAMAWVTVPALIVVGDEDEPCLEPSFFLKKLKRIPASLCFRPHWILLIFKKRTAINMSKRYSTSLSRFQT